MDAEVVRGIPELAYPAVAYPEAPSVEIADWACTLVEALANAGCEHVAGAQALVPVTASAHDERVAAVVVQGDTASWVADPLRRPNWDSRPRSPPEELEAGLWAGAGGNIVLVAVAEEEDPVRFDHEQTVLLPPVSASCVQPGAGNLCTAMS